MEDIKFKLGITEKQIERLIHYSNTDKQVKINTFDAIRFANRQTFDKWRKISRRIYTLTNNLGDLLGIIWFRRQALPLDKDYYFNFDKEFFGTTFAIRIYGLARGKGLSKTFLDKAFKEYKKTKVYLNSVKKGMWIETRKDNLSAISVYKKFGFKIVSKPDKINRIVMTQS